MNTLAQLRAGQLEGATRLDLSAGLEALPPEVYTLADTLEVLNLSDNCLTTLPADLPRLKRLRVVFCSNNPFTTLPPVLGECPALEMIGFKACQISSVPAAALPPTLRWLTLTDNCIEQLPDVFGQVPRLQKLMLAANRLSALPPSLAGCSQLELLRIAGNRLAELPAWLLAMPRLAWLAYAGNPLSAAFAGEPTQAPAAIEWQALALAHTLGEGASGTVYQATLSGQRAVAVKLFKGTRTSDGYPEDEIAACLHAGEHPNLVPMRGRLAGHPEGLPGLVMDLIDPGYRVLAGPPTLHSCTRDAWASGTRLHAGQARTLLAGIASAAAHLHGRGIMHGDLYAHNILHRDGHALLGDFGAASRYPANGETLALALQAIEVRAFGILLEEVLACCEAPPAGWRALSQACQQPDATARPRFSEVLAAL